MRELIDSILELLWLHQFRPGWKYSFVGWEDSGLEIVCGLNAWGLRGSVNWGYGVLLLFYNGYGVLLLFYNGYGVLL